MHYQISRNGQMYGPYTIEDLKRYVTSGHVLLTDLAKSEEMTEWLPVSQLLVGSEASPVTPAPYASVPAGYSQTTMPNSSSAYPDPPNLHWAVVLLLDLLTCSLFQMVWNIILGAWFKRIVPPSRTLVLYIASAVLLVMQGVMGQTLGFMAGRHHGYDYRTYGSHMGSYGIYGMVWLVSWVVRLMARFTFRSELEAHYNTVEPIALRINPVLTFLFGGIYLQSQMNRINDIKRAVRYR